MLNRTISKTSLLHEHYQVNISIWLKQQVVRDTVSCCGTELWELFKFQALPWCFGVTQAGRLISGYWKLRAAVSTGQDCTIPLLLLPTPLALWGNTSWTSGFAPPIFPLVLFICAPQVTKKASQELRMLSPSLSIQRSQCNCPYCCSQLTEM